MAATSFFGGEFFGGEFFNTAATTAATRTIGGPGWQWEEHEWQRTPRTKKRLTWQDKQYWEDDPGLTRALLEVIREQHQRTQENQGQEAQKAAESAPEGLSSAPQATKVVYEGVEVDLSPMLAELPMFVMQIRREMESGDMAMAAMMAHVAQGYIKKLEQDDDDALLALLLAS